jgi:phage-related protein
MTMSKENNDIKESIILEAKKLVEENGSKAVEIVNRKIEGLKNTYSRESDFAFLLLTEVEKLLEAKN